MSAQIYSPQGLKQCVNPAGRIGYGTSDLSFNSSPFTQSNPSFVSSSSDIDIIMNALNGPYDNSIGSSFRTTYNSNAYRASLLARDPLDPFSLIALDGVFGDSSNLPSSTADSQMSTSTDMQIARNIAPAGEPHFTIFNETPAHGSLESQHPESKTPPPIPALFVTPQDLLLTPSSSARAPHLFPILHLAPNPGNAYHLKRAHDADMKKWHGRKHRSSQKEVLNKLCDALYSPEDPAPRFKLHCLNRALEHISDSMRMSDVRALEEDYKKQLAIKDAQLRELGRRMEILRDAFVSVAGQDSFRSLMAGT
ncbi:hypothetical protein EVG20_g5006 [Dentipellis fragilis]|uniref:Uncharacterized protein n=1 Tax=Dentipellis fragilis TaxID=205917 RepID=A0A4Y9YWH9_9AGAM|nr:hypothetical protein EVG20_g5006 [Dentipellis fragilis]